MKSDSSTVEAGERTQPKRRVGRPYKNPNLVGEPIANLIRGLQRDKADLLTALKYVEGWFAEWNVEVGPAEQELFDRLNAAIARAEGAAQ